ncbi:hypothetical protein K8S19_12155 [bacterium]|nr:hypothetical protein [bacterium]
MALSKCSDVVNLRKIFSEANPELEKKFTASLSGDLEKIYNKVVSTSWAPEEEVAQIYFFAAQILYPTNPDRLILLGKAMSYKSYTGIYKVFLRIPNIQFIVKRAAGIWKTYHDKGEASVENITKNSADFVVRKFPDYPEYSREIVKGHLLILFELTGHKNAVVIFKEIDSQELRWQMQW